MITRLKSGQQVEMRNFALTDMVSWGYSGLRGAGIMISQSAAHGIPALYRAARMNAEALGLLELCCWSGYGPERIRRPYVPQSQLFEGVPNDQQSKFNFWETIGESLSWRNQAYIWKNVDPATEKVIEWFALHPDQVQRRHGEFEVKCGDGYVDPVGRGKATYLVDESTILRVRGYGEGGELDPPTPIQVFREALQSPVLRQRSEARMWRRGTSLQLAVEFPQGVSKAQADDWRQSWRETYEGADGETTAVVGGGAVIKPIGMTASDAEYINMAHLTVEDASRIMGVPANLLGVQWMRPVSGELEQDLSTWLRFGLGPQLNRIEDALRADKQLFPLGAQTYPQFDTTEFVRGDLETEYGTVSQAVQAGWMLPDEARAKVGLPPLPGGIGQIPQITPVGGAPNPNLNGNGAGYGPEPAPSAPAEGY